MNKIKNYQLSLLSAALLIIGWPPLPTAFLLFIALVPLLLIREKLDQDSKKHKKFWLWSWFTLFLFNTGTTWWVWNASPSGTVMMLVCNSLIMSLPFLAYSQTKEIYPRLAGLSLIAYYLLFEYWHFNWSAAWPWLTFGKGLASIPSFIQWYEYTGELGGTLLIILINYMILRVIVNKQYKKVYIPLSVLLLMGIISYSLSPFIDLSKNIKTLECVISQPNIDPYTEKFGDGDGYLYPEIQIDFALEPAESLITPNTDILLFPETAIVGYNKESELKDNFLFQPLKKMTDTGKLCIIAGSESFEVYPDKEKPSITARYDSSINKWFDFFNSGMNIKKGEVREIYHKSKLVPGVEKMPFAFLEKLSINLGGTSGSLGVSDKPINFEINTGDKVAPLICYESVFGDYTNEFVREGATILAVMTNDGWWKETPGYKQHLMYGALRCIETRREMIRSANTGISAHINQYGKILKQTKYKERTAFTCKAIPNREITFYVKYGNILGKTSILSLLLILGTLVRKFINRKKKVTA